MDAREFLTKFGPDESERVATAAGTNLAYFKQLAYGARTPSAKLAERLAESSDGRLGFRELLLPAPNAAPSHDEAAA